ncbi:PASTA domain-containing protein [Burkholderia pseudomultivorans]|uniref:PASTA domain-containing protein n=1 Tax=Burkholderia pseudomultivorans TaxID=1207504 RepID=UPI00287659F8|nr:PASTA domain-containing protein [Burkholderia pseudomultivorans]MDS0856895.1 PASTA domain-containing protein [Burkholderia pseudomultivorans]
MFRFPALPSAQRFASVAVLACATLGGTASADTLHTASDIAGIALTPLGALPRSPEKGSVDDFCAQYPEKKLSAAGREVAKHGWIVTSEAPLGRYRVVSFVSGMTPGTSAICFARNANLAIFSGTELVALAYTPRSAKRSLGTVDVLESGALLIQGGDGPGAPLAELHEENGGFRITAIAAERTFCRGRAVVPNVYGQPLDAARKTLIAHGWQPLRARRKPDDSDGAATLVKHGIIEAYGCSGTGMGYCSFNYRSPAGVLGTITMGGEPDTPSENRVIDYGVTCRKP